MANTHKNNIYQRLVYSPLFAGLLTGVFGFIPLLITMHALMGTLVEYEHQKNPAIVRSGQYAQLTTEELLQLVAQRRAERRMLLLTQVPVLEETDSYEETGEEIIADEALSVSSVSSKAVEHSVQSSVHSTVSSSLWSSSAASIEYSSQSSSSVQPQVLPNQSSSISSTVVQSSTSSTPEELKPAAPVEDFPAFGRAVHPVARIPNWGAMTQEAEWSRAYSAITQSEYVPVPAYNIKELTTPMTDLLLNRAKNESLITAKLYYSTRHFGSYHLDSGEYKWIHAGIDLKLPEGTPFGSIAGGRVYAVRTDNTLGLHVIVEHRVNNTVYYSIYGHMQTAAIQAGDTVKPGQILGTVGSSGSSSAPHIHLQINKGDPDWRSSGVLTKAQADKHTVHPIEFIATY